MSVELRGTNKRRVPNFWSLDESLDATLVPEVRTAQLRALRVKRGHRVRRSLIVWVREADKEGFRRKSQTIVILKIFPLLAHRLRKVEYLVLPSAWRRLRSIFGLYVEADQLLVLLNSL